MVEPCFDLGKREWGMNSGLRRTGEERGSIALRAQLQVWEEEEPLVTPIFLAGAG